MHIIIGAGEVGIAVNKVLSKVHNTLLIDVEPQPIENDIKCTHICFPWSDKFTNEVKKYQSIYNAPVVIHSTVPIGTSAEIGAVHSPIRGVHPNLVEGILTFVKFFAGPKPEAIDASNDFKECGVDTYYTGADSRVTEAGKLWSTTQYGVAIIVQKAMRRYCEKHNLSCSDVYTLFGRTYNEGYEELGMDNVQRPVLRHVDGPIGGHCIIPNADLLDDDIGRWIIQMNELDIEDIL